MKKIINLKGMHCISCEMIIEKELKNLSGVKLHMVSHKKGIMEIEYDKESDYEKVVEFIEKNGFNVVENDEKSDEDFVGKLMLNIIALLIVVILFIFSGLFDLNGYLPDTSTMSYSGAFLVGLIASVSTCLAITGGIIIGFAKYIDSTHSSLGHVKVQLGFHLGRIIGFFVLGGLLGITGKIFSLSLSITSILTIVVGILLLYMGLNLLGIIPSLTKFGVHMPKSFASKIEKIGKPEFAPIAGALTFFLPCGFTQTMQLLAISSGSFLGGGLVMLFFALGTFPVLFSVGLGSSYFEGKNFPLFNKIIASILIFFGLTTISNSYNLLSLNTIDNKIKQEIETAVIDQNVDFKQVTVGHDGYQMDPTELVLEQGKNYKITILPDSNGKGCMATQVIPKLSSKVSYVLKGQAINYEMLNAQAGTYEVVCGSMGMLQGTIVVK
ncbi:MAG: sulfite exporter TauE/SafE family protein [Candidatus Gracilibacteria bacterium]|nr:sulfite exporter TauE/SafE family protein [Candidatus Gracilibacteria bacterium]